MTWTNLLNNNTVVAHRCSKTEITDLLEVVERDLKDASIKELSADRRFATAYNAALQLSKIAIACSGYRIRSGGGHHFKTFDAVKISVPTPEVESLADYFDLCRRKRNDIDYDAAEVVTASEAEELVEKAGEFKEIIGEWIKKNFPQFI